MRVLWKSDSVLASRSSFSTQSICGSQVAARLQPLAAVSEGAAPRRSTLRSRMRRATLGWSVLHRSPSPEGGGGGGGGGCAEGVRVETTAPSAAKEVLSKRLPWQEVVRAAAASARPSALHLLGCSRYRLRALPLRGESEVADGAGSTGGVSTWSCGRVTPGKEAGDGAGSTGGCFEWGVGDSAAASADGTCSCGRLAAGSTSKVVVSRPGGRSDDTRLGVSK